MSGWTLAFQIVNFLVLAALLQRFLFKPMNATIARRQDELERVRSESERARREAEQLKQDAEHARARVSEERDQTIAEARTTIERERDEVLEKARGEATAIVDAGKQDVEVEREQAARGLAVEAVTLGVEIARRLLEQVATRRAAESFLDRLCEHLESLPKERLGALRDALDGRDLVVATAPALSPEAQAQWLESIKARLGAPFSARFLGDDGLVLGAELRFPHTTLSFCWRDGLNAARTELLDHAHAH